MPSRDVRKEVRYLLDRLPDRFWQHMDALGARVVAPEEVFAELRVLAAQGDAKACEALVYLGRKPQTLPLIDGVPVCLWDGLTDLYIGRS